MDVQENILKIDASGVRPWFLTQGGASEERGQVVHLYFFLTLLGIFHIIQTREASKSSSWLVSELTEWLLDALGALMGKGGCRDMVACR